MGFAELKLSELLSSSESVFNFSVVDCYWAD